MTCYKRWERKLFTKNLLMNQENVVDCGKKMIPIMC
ncbi:hypothetical protein E1A91_D01G068900v1 [Gossypium mustelinum]|uniref:Uncharacterized protein n=1 Tax=Gossypium mustelinum TaxID=34275 RepID=A0A5D2W4H0_GOSMU|nr:hypothetical protein E1A91_D01G068900v1 [Gossypium mustelinum]